ncbi:MAG: hypothetical protein CFH01_00857 [Alphaproteobacteria bacterium MarineAlpha2_Bin1]|nr:MAG: hypothetical protein CFH01_00857 [Alphaproteobacteria bacterium MarineAlpha2_Bin1]|tara:strand:+ start:1231 stop:1503 length:273 start_codon:yes stop_codon:yes gene_type:complete
MLNWIKNIVNIFKKRIFLVYHANSGSILRTVIYTVGHFIIAATCVWYFTGASFFIAITDAIVEPIINGIWYYMLDRYWASKDNLGLSKEA